MRGKKILETRRRKRSTEREKKTRKRKIRRREGAEKSNVGKEHKGWRGKDYTTGTGKRITSGHYEEAKDQMTG